MTVIAADLREMAADSLCHEDDSSHYYAEKMVRLPDGSIVGGAGNRPEILIDWLKRGANPMDRPAIDAEKDDFSCLHLTANGLVLYTNTTLGIPLKDKNYAVGCGRDVALYLMRRQKKTPAIAVREATAFNMFCGGKVDVMVLNPKKKKKS